MATVGLSGWATAPNSIHLEWYYSHQPTGSWSIWRDGSVVHTQALGDLDWGDDTVSPGRTYKYRVTAGPCSQCGEPLYSDEITITTPSPPTAPSLLVAQAVDIDQINLTWQDNSSDEQDFHIEISNDGVTGWAEISPPTVGANITYKEVTGLASDTLKYFRVRAHNSSGYSGYSNVASARTFAAVAQPTNLQVVAYSGTEVDFTFQDNSTAEDDHRLEMKTTGAFAEVKTVSANVQGGRVSGLSPGVLHTFRIRARQGATYSAYSAEATATTIAVPGAPSALALSAVQDDRMRLTWEAPTSGGAVVGYRVEKSLNGSSWTEIAKIYTQICSYLATGLTPSQLVYFRIRAFNAAGSGDYCTSASATTLAAYAPSKLEVYLRNPVGALVVLAEGRPKKTLAGWTLKSGATYTYQVTLSVARVPILEVLEDGDALIEAASIAAVETTAGSWYFDFYGRVLYVRSSDGSSPVNFHTEAVVGIYIGNRGGVFNERKYLPFLRTDGISDLTQELTPLRQGNFACSSGALTFINALQAGGKHFFDDLHAGLTWINTSWRLLLGAPGFAYSDFRPWFTGLVSKHTINDKSVTHDLVDPREGIHRDLPINHFWPSEYPGIGDADKMKEVPVLYGSIVGATPTKIGTNIYKYHDGACGGLNAVRRNGTTLTAGTHYFDQPSQGILTFVSTLTIAEGDIIEVDYNGRLAGDNTLITNGAHIFKDTMNRDLALADSELNLDEIWETMAAKTAILMVPMFTTQNSQSIIRTLEHSIGAHTTQDAEGRIGIKVLATTAPSSAVHILEHQQWGLTKEVTRDDRTYKTVNVYYSQDPQGQTWSQVTRTSARLGYQYRAAKTLDVYTYLTDADDAGDLADELMDTMELEKLKFPAGPNALLGQAGDPVVYSRTRYFSAAGPAIARTVRVTKITKSLGARKVQIEGEDITA